jgi:hypothetical protein
MVPKADMGDSYRFHDVLVSWKFKRAEEGPPGLLRVRTDPRTKLAQDLLATQMMSIRAGHNID